NQYDTVTDSIDIVVSNAVPVPESALVDIAGDSEDNQAFAVGVPVQLTFSVDFTDGRTYSTDDEATDSSFMRWAISPAGTEATISGEGVLNTAAVTSGITLTITATGKNQYDTVTDSIDVDVFSLAGESIDIFDTGSGKLFTSSPSVPYLDSIGGSDVKGTWSDHQEFGPSGDFYTFDLDSANALCTTYSTHSLGGRADWRLATKDELKEELSDNMFAARGWPAVWHYISATSDSSDRYYYVSLYDGFVGSSLSLSTPFYVSCVSNP
ncbi:hypothetical protein OTK54_25665, partial [Vibrio chagasii]|nr:hypothetical protein [Vibrio chagasii]